MKSRFSLAVALAAALFCAVPAHARVNRIVIDRAEPLANASGYEVLRGRAVAAVQGRNTLAGGRAWNNIKELAATTNDVWETSSAPR